MRIPPERRRPTAHKSIRLIFAIHIEADVVVTAAPSA
jgi:hypothetical protein